jgi:hypothetical protein
VHLRYYVAGLVSLLTFLVYLVSLGNEFVSWDDPGYVYKNNAIRSFDLAFLKWAFFEFHEANWHPLTWLSHALDYAVWGLNPMGHHLTNNVLHTVNTFLVVLLAARLVEAWKGAAAGRGNFSDGRAIVITAGVTGLLFGLHPLHVESVAWVSERKDLLCALFYLLSVMAYAKYAGSEAAERELPLRVVNRHYLFSGLFFMLALLSKPMAVSLPVVLLILDWHPFRRMESLKMFRQACLEKLPFIVLSLVSSALTIMAQESEKAMEIMVVVPLPTRVLVAVRALVAYLWEMVLPVDLVPLYPYPKDVSFFSAEYLGALVLVVAITAWCVVTTRRRKIFIAVWGYYVVTLLPVIGLVQVGSQSMADRYMYLPSLGPFLVAGLSAAWVWGRKDARPWRFPAAKGVGVAVALALALSLSLLTIKQIGIWKNGIVLWNYVIKRDPGISLAYNNRGLVFDEMGQPDKALADFNEAIALDPSNVEAYNNRGVVFDKAGWHDKALADFDKALALNLGFPQAYNNRGIFFYKMGQFDKALENFDSAIALNPSYSEACNNRGTLYLETGNKERAVSDYQKACDLGVAISCDALQALR